MAVSARALPLRISVSSQDIRDRTFRLHVPRRSWRSTVSRDLAFAVSSTSCWNQRLRSARTSKKPRLHRLRASSSESSTSLR